MPLSIFQFEDRLVPAQFVFPVGFCGPIPEYIPAVDVTPVAEPIAVLPVPVTAPQPQPLPRILEVSLPPVPVETPQWPPVLNWRLPLPLRIPVNPVPVDPPVPGVVVEVAPPVRQFPDAFVYEAIPDGDGTRYRVAVSGPHAYVLRYLGELIDSGREVGQTEFDALLSELGVSTDQARRIAAGSLGVPADYFYIPLAAGPETDPIVVPAGRLGFGGYAYSELVERDARGRPQYLLRDASVRCGNDYSPRELRVVSRDDLVAFMARSSARFYLDGSDTSGVLIFTSHGVFGSPSNGC